MRGTGSHFRNVLFFIYNQNEGKSMGMRPKINCYMHHSGIMFTWCVSTKCPTQALHTLLSHWIHACLSQIGGDTVFFNDMLADPYTCAPVGVGGAYAWVLNHSTSFLLSVNLSPRFPIFCSSNRFCVVFSWSWPSRSLILVFWRRNWCSYAATVSFSLCNSSAHSSSSFCASSRFFLSSLSAA